MKEAPALPATTAIEIETGRPVTAEAAADEAAVTTLLNCYLRETGSAATGTVRLERLGLEVAAPVRHRSATGQHAYQLPATLARPGGAPAALDHVTLAALLGRELAFAEGGRARLGEFVTAVASSARNVALFLAGPDRPQDGAGATPFLRAEQALAAGHPLHPAAKSRLPMTTGEVGRYAPELGAAFPLRWFRADRSLVAQDSALRTGAAELLAGLLAGDELAARFPWFAIVRDPAWLTVRTGEDRAESGFEVVLRENPYPAGDRHRRHRGGRPLPPRPGRRAVAAGRRRPGAGRGRRPAGRRGGRGVVPPLPGGGRRPVAVAVRRQGDRPGGPPAEQRGRAGRRAGRPGSATATTRATTSRRRPPTGCGGCCPASTRPATPSATTPWPTSASATTWPSTTCSGSSAPSGRDGVADERDLLADLAAHLAAWARAHPPVPPLVATLLGSPRLRVKANLRTRLDDMDELVGPLASQSVYVEVANPLAGLGGPP